MLPASVLAIGSLIAGRSPRSHLHPRDAAPRAAPPRCCTAPSAEPPEEEPRKVQGGDQPRKLLTTLQTTRQRAAPSAGTGAVQLARFAPSPRGRDGGGTPLPRSSTKRQKIIALFRGAQEAIGRDDLPKARVLLRHCLEIDQVTSCPLEIGHGPWPHEPHAHRCTRPLAPHPSPRASRSRSRSSKPNPNPSPTPNPGGLALLAGAGEAGGASGPG